MTAPRHQVGEADLVDLAQIGMIDPVADGDDTLDVEFDPADVRNRDVCLIEVGRRTCRAIAKSNVRTASRRATASTPW